MSRPSMFLHMALSAVLFLLVLSVSCLSVFAETVFAETLPDAWQKQWNSPPSVDRPLKIEHKLCETELSREGLEVFTKHGFGGPEEIPRFLEYGLGGLVTNVSFNEYLRSQPHLEAFAKTINQLAEKDQVLWLYDEDGYPSPSAGGLVLDGHPEFEALELAYDAEKSGDDAFIVRPSYEYTHASNNYYAYRRYPNLLDPAACRRFIDVTHEQYKKRVGQHFGDAIHATFTDEPSLMGVNIGLIPERFKHIQCKDPVDPNVPNLPVVSWSKDIPADYQKLYGEDLLKDRKSLFTGDSEKDRQVRHRFWKLIAGRLAKSYFGQLQEWCHANHLLSSGHLLYEESIIHQVPLYGNALESIQRMDIPGMDQLSSEPQCVVWASWLTAAIPSSAAMHNGSRRVMTEVGDFSDTTSGKGPASLPKMCATAAWQAAWGVTDFTLYYQLHERTPADMKAYSDFVGRLNAILKPAKVDRHVLLYYPIDSLWEEYLPIAEKLDLKKQSPRAQAIGKSFFHAGQKMQQSQVPFTLIDYRNLDKAEVKEANFVRSSHDYHAIVIPAETKLGPAETAKLDAFQKAGGTIVKLGSPEGDKQFVALIEKEGRVTPRDKYVAYGRFERDGRTIHLLINTGDGPFLGHLRPVKQGLKKVVALDPATGQEKDQPVQNGLVLVKLKSFETMLFVE